MKSHTWVGVAIGMSLLIVSVVNVGVITRPAEATSDSDGVASKAFSLRMEGKVDAAQDLLEKTIESGSGGAAEFYELARLQFYLYDFEGAKQSMEKAITKEPENARYYSFAALALSFNAVNLSKKPETRPHVQDEITGAAHMQEKAVKLASTNNDYRLRLLELYNSSGNEADAKTQAKILSESNPVYGAVTRLRIQGGNKTSGRLEDLLDLLPKHDNSVLLHEALFHEYFRAGETESGLEHLEKAVKLDPSRAVLFLYLGRHNIQKPDINLAEKGITRFLEFKPEQPVPLRAFAVNSLAVVRRMQGEKQASETLRSEAREIDPFCWTTFMPPPQELFEKP